MSALFWVDAIQERGYPTPRLILPVMPGQRQDRLNPEGDFLFTAKSVAAEINARNFPWVMLVDPHSLATPALVNRAIVTDATSFVSNLLLGERYHGVISPDAGADKRAEKWAHLMRVPLFRAWKTRSTETGKISGFGAQTTPKGHYLVVDDICDGGGTFLGLGSVVRERGVTLDLFVTHGYFSNGLDKLGEMYRNIYCTDSVIGEKGSATVLPLCSAILEGRL